MELCAFSNLVIEIHLHKCDHSISSSLANARRVKLVIELAFLTVAILYGFKSISFGHAIFHVFVLVGSISHFSSMISPASFRKTENPGVSFLSNCSLVPDQVCYNAVFLLLKRWQPSICYLSLGLNQ